MVCSVSPGPWGSWERTGWEDLVRRLCRTSSCCLCNEEFGYCATVMFSCFRILESLCCPAWYWRSHALRLAVGWRSLSVIDSEKVKVCSLPGMDETLLYASVICFWMVCRWSACDAAWSTLCRWEFWAIHWLYVYTWRLCFTVLVQFLGWNGWWGCLRHM